MGKRRNDSLRSKQEIRQDSERNYDKYIRDAQEQPSRISPVFTEPPHYGIKLRDNKDHTVALGAEGVLDAIIGIGIELATKQRET